ncbi:MAG TPA: NADH-quinone oxidoreductase subunit L [Acidimicrobiaceae bacterium]|nr:NADH-quinone oxidoreductase subunit L [Acidimicrobiaceae bacterium]
MIHAAFLMFLLPLAGFVVLALGGRRLGDPLAGWVGTGAVAGSFVVACITYAGLLKMPSSGRSFDQTLFTWIPVGGLNVKAALLIDPLSMTMALFVTGVSTLIHLYSIGYMKGDKDFPKFFLYMNLFVASMLMLVLGDNLLFTFVGWEGVGVCSYWLIAYWFGRPTAASAGKKAFLYNRLADVGFLVAVFLVFDKTGTLQYHGIFAHASSIDPAARTAICLLLFVAAVGKSAQLPLFPWLADAMEGPTPVSALIHAATMVTAGVFLMCRINPLLGLSHPAQLVVASIGAVTALVAATIGCAQQDIKKVLAYSTVSQLGYMFLAAGTGAYEAAIFLMVAHAFFKAELFLGAGSVIHGLDNEQDLKRMGNLRRWLPLTFATFVFGWLAIAGIPPLSGFWAKGDVLDNAYARFPVLWFVGLVTAALTAYYMTRLSALAFFGDDRWRQVLQAPAGDHDAHPHEAPWVMAWPLVVLAVLSLAGGVLLLPWHPGWSPLRWLDPVFGSRLFDAHLSGTAQWVLGVVDSLVALVGLAVALPLWARQPERPELEPAMLQRSYYLDDIYDAVIGRPGQALARFSLVVVDNQVIDGAVNGIGRLARNSGSIMRRLQTGFVRQYALGIALGAAGLLVFMAARAWA